MKTTRMTNLGIAGALLLGSAMVQAGETDATIDQRNQVWSMQGEQSGSYTGTPLQSREQKRIQTRTRVHTYGDGQGSRYGQGYESRGNYGSGASGYGYGSGSRAGGSGAARSGGQGGGRR
jgi:hypothetical protein